MNHQLGAILTLWAINVLSELPFGRKQLDNRPAIKRRKKFIVLEWNNLLGEEDKTEAIHKSAKSIFRNL